MASYYIDEVHYARLIRLKGAATVVQYVPHDFISFKFSQ
jgi:hypothetical protein